MKKKIKNKMFSTKTIYSVYQPIVDIKKKEIFGYEALTRGLGGMGLPEQLFRRSYQDGTTNTFDLKCLETAIGILPRLDKRTLLFLNVEPMTLGDTFPKKQGKRFLSKIKSYEKQIVFEITEGMKGRDFSYVKKSVQSVRKLGCAFAIDDVAGIGSKLMQFLSLKPDFIKLDMSLVRGIAKKPFQQKLLKQILELGKKSKTTFIAEGVETRSELKFIKKSGITIIQGFYFARPKKILQKSIKNL